MASVSMWLEGARLRTLPAAAAPVIIGAGAAARLGGFSAGKSLLALAVALSLQVGVNFANDYSDGVRGTDDARVGPTRLTASGQVPAKTVLTLALGCFAVAGLLGLTLLWWSGTWWLLAAGITAVAAAWFYTGGSHPYGYAGVGLSELFVFVFFGLMATVATTWVQVPSAPWWLWVSATGVGLASIALLFVNNIRDIPTDREVGKKTLAVRLGQRRSRFTYCLLLVGTYVCFALALKSVSIATTLIAVAALFPVVHLCGAVRRGAQGPALLSVLRSTGFLTLGYGVILAAVFTWWN
ncbi:MAG: 1,4-dihydroxy-2-naphthoate polyprenyltransferase [Actinomycetaceae bacterium]|nr:1,4-dihydroxy-2-naphthoate polyprenyltransferase [Actinomycetaceae bacterium]